MRLPGYLALCGVALLLSTPAGGEIYRFTDAQGREHFTSDLQAVPAAQREAARSRAEAGGGNLNFHAAPPPSPRRAVPSKPAAVAPTGGAGDPCAAARREVKALLKPIRYHQRKLEGHERSARDITRSEISRRRAEIRAEKARAWLDKAEAKLAAFRDAGRREGLDPGCLRP